MSVPGSDAVSTVVALFEDPIDARLALDAVRKSGVAADRVSLLVAFDGDERNDMDVGLAVDETALDHAAGWLLGLSTLVVPGCGTVLAAGPLGAALSELASVPAEDPDPDEEPSGKGIAALLEAFGFGDGEAGYVAHRVAAGSPLVAAAVDDADAGSDMRRLMADADAVHIGTAETPDRAWSEAAALLVAPPEAAGHGAVEIADAVGPLVRESEGDVRTGLTGRAVVDLHGEPAGEIDDVLVEDGSRRVRWIVVGSGGVLGMGRRRVAVPAACGDLDADPVRLALPATEVREAPGWDADQPFSRHEERTAFSHFGLPPYWEAGLGAHPAGS